MGADGLHQYVRARPHLVFLTFRRGAGLPARHPHIHRRAVCEGRIFGLPGLPRRPIRALNAALQCLGMARNFMHTP